MRNINGLDSDGEVVRLFVRSDAILAKMIEAGAEARMEQAISSALARSVKIELRPPNRPAGAITVSLNERTRKTVPAM